ncbi:unnamed protein product [Boreogadus saida]
MCFADLAQRIAPGQWRTKHGRDFEGFPCQTTGNYCGVLTLMYAFCICTDAPFLFTELDMADIRKWWFNYYVTISLKSHGRSLAYWTKEARALLAGLLEPVFRVPKARKTEHKVQSEKSDLCFISE